MFAGVFAMVCFHLHYLHIQQKLDTWHSVDTLRGVKVLGMMGALAGMAGLIWYIFIALYHHIRKFTVGQGGITVQSCVLLNGTEVTKY
jgi:hypothetical protein